MPLFGALARRKRSPRQDRGASKKRSAWPRWKRRAREPRRQSRGGGRSGRQEKRIAKLEQERRPAAKVLCVWRDRSGETTAQAIARSFPDGVPAGPRLAVCSFGGLPARPRIRLTGSRPAWCTNQGNLKTCSRWECRFDSDHRIKFSGMELFGRRQRCIRSAGSHRSLENLIGTLSRADSSGYALIPVISGKAPRSKQCQLLPFPPL